MRISDWSSDVCSSDLQDEKGVAIRVVSKDDHEQTLQARYLIGADGVRSMVRDTIGAKMEGRYGISHHYNIIFYAPGLAEAHRHGPGAIYWQMNSDGFSALAPMDDVNRWFFMPGGTRKVPRDRQSVGEGKCVAVRYRTGGN